MLLNVPLLVAGNNDQYQCGSHNDCAVMSRGGVEDTRLKAKDTKNFEAKAKDTDTSVLQKKKKVFSDLKKKGLQNFFSGDLSLRKPKKGFCRFSARFLAFSNKISMVQNFRGLEASRPRPRTSNCVLKDILEAKDVLKDSTSDDMHFVQCAGLHPNFPMVREGRLDKSLLKSKPFEQPMHIK